MFEYKGVKIHWLGHDTFILEHGKSVCIDPFKLKKTVQADLVLVTHEHYDHWDMDALKKIVTARTTLITIKANAADASKLGAKQVIAIRPGEKKEVEGVTVEAVPAYNLTKFREPGKVFHPKEDEKVGYIVTMGGVRFYHAGDTDVIPEMSNFKTDVAFLPVSGIYVMTAEEAVEAARMIKPALAIPMHYGTGIGSETDAQRFKSKAPCPVEILQRE